MMPANSEREYIMGLFDIMAEGGLSSQDRDALRGFLTEEFLSGKPTLESLVAILRECAETPAAPDPQGESADAARLLAVISPFLGGSGLFKGETTEHGSLELSDEDLEQALVLIRKGFIVYLDTRGGEVVTVVKPPADGFSC